MNKFSIIFWLATFLFIGSFGSSAQPAAAQEISGLSFQLKIGFDGYIKQDTWAPIRIVAGNTGADIEGEVRLQIIRSGETYARSLSLPAQSQKEVTLLVPLSFGDFELAFVSEGETLYQERHTPRHLPPRGYLVGVVASDPSLLNFLAGLQTPQGESLSVAHLSLAELPEISQSLSALDSLIFNDVDTTGLTEKQKAVLSAWVAAGGHLIVGGGPNGNATAAGLQFLLPAQQLQQIRLEALPALANFANEAIPDQGPYLAAVPQRTLGWVDIIQEEEVLLLHKALGEGKISYFALDFGLAPMNGWAGNTPFWETILDPLEPHPPYYTTHNAISSLNNALANISFAILPAPTLLMVFLCLYIVILVPVNYIILRQFKRRDWAWITIPGLILLFSLIGYIAGFRARGGQPLLRQISIIQQIDKGSVEAQTTIANVDTFIGLYSPNRGRFTLRFPDDTLVRITDNGNGYSSIRSGLSDPTTIRYDSSTELQNLWTDVGTMATAIAHSTTTHQPIWLDLQIVRQDARWKIVGSIDNRNNFAIEDVVLLAADHGVQLQRLEPGQTAIDHPLTSLNIAGSYSDLTIWGELYYQLNDPNQVVNDQIIRSIFWPNNSFAGQTQPQTLAANAMPESIILFGWQEETEPPTPVKVLNTQVDQETSSLLIVKKPYRETP